MEIHHSSRNTTHGVQALQNWWLSWWTSQVAAWELHHVEDFPDRFYIMVYIGIGLVSLVVGAVSQIVFVFASLNASQVRHRNPVSYTHLTLPTKA